jgi:hypothetical protein
VQGAGFMPVFPLLALNKTGALSWAFAAGETGSFTYRLECPAFQRNCMT